MEPRAANENGDGVGRGAVGVAGGAQVWGN